MTKLALALIGGLAALYLLVCLLMWAFQRNLQYFPQQAVQAPAAYGVPDFADLRLKSLDGTLIQAWHKPAPAGRPTIVYFHGNGGNLAGRAGYFRRLSDAGYGVLALSYRGYGASDGSPSEEGFYQDARALIAYAEKDLSIKPASLIFYGESIGTGVAVQMATEVSPAALILQSPYSSITALAQDNYPWLPAGLLLKDRFDSLSKIGRVKAPLLLFHGELDRVVPVHYGRQLFAAAAEPKQAIYFPDVGHGDFNQDQLTQLILAFCAAQKI